MTGYRHLSTIFVFGGASAVLALLFGVALGNIVWGIPMDANGSFIKQHTRSLGNHMSLPIILFVRIEIACFFLDPDPCWQIMKTFFLSLFYTSASTPRKRLQIMLSILALRYQLAVLERSARPPQLSPADRCLQIAELKDKLAHEKDRLRPVIDTIPTLA
jgi:hypothetical protein